MKDVSKEDKDTIMFVNTWDCKKERQLSKTKEDIERYRYKIF